MSDAIQDYKDFTEWVVAHDEEIIEAYLETEPEPPEHIYEGVLDDDYSDAFDTWAENLDLNDIPEEYIEGYYLGATGKTLSNLNLDVI